MNTTINAVIAIVAALTICFVLAIPARANDTRPTVIVTVDRTALGVCEAPDGWEIVVQTNGRSQWLGSRSQVTIVSARGSFSPVSAIAYCGDADPAPLPDNAVTMTFHNL